MGAQRMFVTAIESDYYSDDGVDPGQFTLVAQLMTEYGGHFELLPCAPGETGLPSTPGYWKMYCTDPAKHERQMAENGGRLSFAVNEAATAALGRKVYSTADVAKSEPHEFEAFVLHDDGGRAHEYLVANDLTDDFRVLSHQDRDDADLDVVYLALVVSDPIRKARLDPTFGQLRLMFG